MKVNLDFTLFIDVIEFNPIKGKYLETYVNEFYEWYHFGKTINKSSSRGFVINEQIYSWNGKAFIDFMNQVYPESSAKLLESDVTPGKEDSSLMYISLN